MRRRGSMFLGLLALLALTLATALPAHAATRIGIDVRMDTTYRIEIAGQLTDGRQAVQQAPVRATIDGRTLAEARTRGNGQFSLAFTVPADLRSGQQRLTVSFDGGGNHSAASSSVILEFPGTGSQEDPATAQPTPMSTPSDAAPTSTPDPAPLLTAEVDDTAPDNGAVVSITGTLTLPDGQVLGGAGIELHGPQGESEEAFVLTADDGTFVTFYEVPVDHEGPLELTVRSTADSGFSAAQANVALDVQLRAVASAPTSPDPSASPTSTAAPAPASEPSQTPTQAEVLPQADEFATSPSTTAATASVPGMPGWMVATLLGVGGTVCAIAAAVVVGAARRRGPSGTEFGLDVFEADPPKRSR